MTRCEICGNGPAAEAGGVTIYRHNKPGEMPARWRCRKDREKRMDAETEELVDVLETRWIAPDAPQPRPSEER